MTPRKQAPTAITVVALLALTATAGCHPSDSGGSSSRPDPASVAAGQQKAMQDIQNNPSIPPQVKAKVVKDMQGQFKPAAIPSKDAPPTAPK